MGFVSMMYVIVRMVTGGHHVKKRLVIIHVAMVVIVWAHNVCARLDMKELIAVF